MTYYDRRKLGSTEEYWKGFSQKPNSASEDIHNTLVFGLWHKFLSDPASMVGLLKKHILHPLLVPDAHTDHFVQPLGDIHMRSVQSWVPVGCSLVVPHIDFLAGHSWTEPEVDRRCMRTLDPGNSPVAKSDEWAAHTRFHRRMPAGRAGE